MGVWLIESLRLTVLVEDTVEESNKKKLITGHGLSILVEAEVNGVDVCVLMDTGPSSKALLNNIDVLGVNPRRVDAVVLSHGHYDHTDGLMGALKSIGKRVPVLAHPEAFNLKFSVDPKLRFNGSAFTVADVEGAGGILFLSKDSIKIADGIITTGEIERLTSYEKVEGFWTIKNNRVVKDSMPDDQALVINMKDKGLVVITGCAHAGVINTVNYARKITGTSRVYAVLGGFHLIDASEERIEATIRDLARFDPMFLGPCHCTGEKAISRIKEAFGDKCHRLRTGDTVTL